MDWLETNWSPQGTFFNSSAVTIGFCQIIRALSSYIWFSQCKDFSRSQLFTPCLLLAKIFFLFFLLLLKEWLRTHTSVQCQWSEILTLTRVGGTRTCLCGDVEEAADIDFLGNVGDTQWYYLLLTLWHTLGERLRYERTFRHPEWYNYQYIRHWTLALDIGLRVLHTISIMFQFLQPKTKLKVFGFLPLHIFGCNVEISILSTFAGGGTF